MQISDASLGSKRIAEWSVGEKKISLYRSNPKEFTAYSSEGNSRRFKSPHYHIDYAINLVRMFRNTIYVNLSQDILDSSCFLPKLCLEEHNNKTICIALFGRIDKKVSATGEAKGLRWGVFHSSSREHQTFEVSDTVASEFIMRAPNTNRESFESGYDKNGKQFKRPAADHYEMDSYVKRFSVNLIYTQTNLIQGVALRYVSQIDRNIFLDENQWAVTFGSAKDSTKNFGSQLITERFGHALLACEGITENGPFLNYVHVTQNPINRSYLLKDDEAQLEIIKTKTPLNSLNGPTWLRSRHLVEKILDFAQSMEKAEIPIKFALYGSYFKSDSMDWYIDILKRIKSSPNEEFRKLMFSSMKGLAFRLELPDVPSTCLDLVHRIAEKGGIIFCGRAPLTSPINQIQKLKSSPIELLSEDCFETAESINALNQRISSACVFLTPNNSPIEKYEIWARVIWRIEDPELRQIVITMWQKEIEGKDYQEI